MSTDIIYVPLNKLDVDPLNVRQTYSQQSIKEFAANIEAEGILQNLLGRKAPGNGRYYVSAGGRRYRAARLLAEAGKLTADYSVPLKEITKEQAVELSLAENCLRETLNPADQFEAFRDLANNGQSVKDIAAKFGTTESIVKKRLALGRVAPELRDLYRREQMSLDQLAAFTVNDDHDEQKRVWETLPSYNRTSHAIKHALVGEGIRGTDKRIRFLGGFEAYEAAGGEVRRDLFDEQGGGYATDAALVEKLVAGKLAEAAENVKAEGWKWVEIVPDIDWTELRAYDRRYPEKVELTATQQDELNRLHAQYDALTEQIDTGDAGENAEVDLDALLEKIDQLDRAVFPSATLQIGGALVSLTYLGELCVERGLVKTKDKPQQQNDEEEDDRDTVGNAPTPVLKHSVALIEDLTAQKTAALRLELANNPAIALAAVVHVLLLQVAYADFQAIEHSALELSLTHTRLEGNMKQPEGCTALAEVEALHEQFGSRIPGNPTDLWNWCLDQSRAELLDLLAFAAAHTVNAVESKFARGAQIEHANRLGRALTIDMHSYFQPTADSYFQYLNRNSIEAAVTEACGADCAKGIANMKKTVGVLFAENMVKGINWLPKPVRFDAVAAVIGGNVETSEEYPFRLNN
ncbi:ParB/RepB/Spo0J family partition protein [Roseibium sp. M-1]